VKLGPDGLPLVEWVPLEMSGSKLVWGLWCRRCGATKRIDEVPDGETAKTLLVDAVAEKHAACDSPLKP
jgi:hypothetical protein